VSREERKDVRVDVAARQVLLQNAAGDQVDPYSSSSSRDLEHIEPFLVDWSTHGKNDHAVVLSGRQRFRAIQQAKALKRPAKDEPRVLLVTARRNPNNWIFPKGHIEDGESRKDAAVREAREEAGVDGKVAGRAGSMSFTFGDNRYRVHYFVVTTSDALAG